MTPGIHRAGGVTRRAAGAVTLVLAASISACGGSAPSASVGPAALPAGTYTSQLFQPPVTLTLPDGWVIGADSRLYFSVHPAGNDMIGLHLFRDPKAAVQDAACTAAPEPLVGTTSGDLAAWILARPGLSVGPPGMADVGGLRGVTLDVALQPSWTEACPFANGVPSVPLFNSPEIDHWVVVGNERLRVHLLDLPGGGLVAVDLDAFDGAQFEDLVSASSGIVGSLQFAADPAAAPASVGPGASASP